MTLLDIFDQCALIGRLNRELRRSQADYRSMQQSYQVALTRLDLANQREKALAAALEEARAHLECFSIDNADLEKVNEALRNGLCFFDPSKETP